METKNSETIDERAVNSVKYPTWKKVMWVGAGVAATVGLGVLANKFGFLPKKIKVVEKIVENSRPVVKDAFNAVNRVSKPIAREFVRSNVNVNKQ